MNNSFRSSDLIKLHSITLTNTYINFGGGDGLMKQENYACSSYSRCRKVESSDKQGRILGPSVART